jgi:methylthioribose-1-phosphate isomerase
MARGAMPLRITGERVEALDQTALPAAVRYFEFDSVETVAEAIAMRVRGAPLLGLVGAFGMAIAARTAGPDAATLHSAAARLRAARPTAVDLGRAVDQSLQAALALPEHERADALWLRACDYLACRRAEDLALARRGLELLPRAARVLTHCNTGPLATGGIGTALAIVTLGHERGLIAHCFTTETRPLLQGARLTTWELQTAGVPTTLLPDTAAAGLVTSGQVDIVIVGADRIAANGDTANKIGTFGLALAAVRARLPFVIAAPTSTIDFACPDGAAIPIEFRPADEVGGYGGQRWAPDGIAAYNPAFDVTPADLVTAIVTERGTARPPYGASLQRLLEGG